MPALFNPPPARVLTLPDAATAPTSIRAKAMLFHDPRSVALLAQAERVARSDATVLVIGETGTGKELIARHLHAASGRRGPFVAVNCGAFSESLIDAELFGHESGAFTGASQARAGWFEAAQGGTLFLDEIGDLPLPLQVKLLRVLQERQVTRLGSRKPVALDVRLVAATNIDLRRAVEAQRFRADLYYRIGVATLILPPLRERPADILPLARHFIGVYGPRLGLPHAVLSPEAQAALNAYAWPGNIRELENVVHVALVVCRDGVVRAEDVHLVAPLEGAATACAADTHDRERRDGVAGPADEATRGLLAAIERFLAVRPSRPHAAIEAALVRTAYQLAGDNQVQAARVLGVTRNTLRTLLKRHGLLATTPPASLGSAFAPPLAH